jgi:Holliday junction resolvase-like predicted endonuclease
MRALSFSLILLWPLLSFADRGQLCEDKAYEFYLEHYNSKYKIHRNIEYSKQVKPGKPKPSSILGEIDILVLNKHGELVEICEVKASINATKRAKKQLEKFKKNCIYGKCSFWNKKELLDFDMPSNKDRIIYTIKTFEDFIDIDEIESESEDSSDDTSDYDIFNISFDFDIF